MLRNARPHLRLLAVTATAIGALSAGAVVPAAGNATGVTVIPGGAPAGLVSGLLGPGVTASNATFTGFPYPSRITYGTFSGGASTVGIDSGVVLSTGQVKDLPGPNEDGWTSTSMMWAGDADLEAIAGTKTYDAAVLEFDFVPVSDTLTFRYVFGSEEYNEYVGSRYNDVFGLFVNGVNCAVVPGTQTPVAINTINSKAHAAYYVDNDIELTWPEPAPHNIEMDGFTTPLTCEAEVTPGVTNHVKLAITDVDDWRYDSWVLLESGSFTSRVPNNPPVCTSAIAGPGSLWPPNHKLVNVALTGVTDPDEGDTVTTTITGVTQDEPLNGLGDGDTAPDAVISADGGLRLRAERSGTGDGRVYVVAFTAKDSHGATCSGTVNVGAVPHDQRKGGAAVDSGQKYNSLG